MICSPDSSIIHCTIGSDLANRLRPEKVQNIYFLITYPYTFLNPNNSDCISLVARNIQEKVKKVFLVKRDCTRVAPVELSIDPCISLTMTNTFHDHPDYPINRSHRHLGNTNRMLIFLRTYTFCQFSRELPRSFHSESKAECNPNNLFVLANLFSLKTIVIGLE